MDGKNRLQPGTAPRGTGLSSPPMDAPLEQMASTEENARALVDRLRRKLADRREAQDLTSPTARDERNNESHATGDRIAKLQSSGAAKPNRVSSAPIGERSPLDESDAMLTAESTTKCTDSYGDSKPRREKRARGRSRSHSRSRSRSRSASPRKSKKKDEESRVGGRKGAKGDGGARRSGSARLEERLCEWKTERAAEVWTQSLDVEQHGSTTPAVAIISSRIASVTCCKSITRRYSNAISGVNAPNEPPALVSVTEHRQRDSSLVEYTRVSDSSATKLLLRASACGISDTINSYLVKEE